jgi:hypothetical protein
MKSRGKISLNKCGLVFSDFSLNLLLLLQVHPVGVHGAGDPWTYKSIVEDCRGYCCLHPTPPSHVAQVESTSEHDLMSISWRL